MLSDAKIIDIINFHSISKLIYYRNYNECLVIFIHSLNNHGVLIKLKSIISIGKSEN